jgi:hypothetical protein
VEGSEGHCDPLACNISDSDTHTQSTDPAGTFTITPDPTTKPVPLNTEEGLPSVADRAAWLLALCVSAGTLGAVVFN